MIDYTDKIFEFKDVTGQIVTAKFVEMYNGEKEEFIKVKETKFGFIFLLRPSEQDIKWKIIS